MRRGGCWIFLSHSSKDILKVRHIRNVFEQNGQNPLAFHLRCLSTDTAEGRAELDSLIKREIDAREWFVFCESAAAAESEYVQMEKDYILRTGKKKIWSIDMSLSFDELTEAVLHICKAIKVFISCPHQHPVADMLTQALIALDYDVWTEQDLSPCVPLWSRSVEDFVLETISSGGFYIDFIPKEGRTPFCRQEFLWAEESGATIIPILENGSELPVELRDKCCIYYQLPENPTSETIYQIVDLIETDLKKQLKRPFSPEKGSWNDLPNKA